MLDHRELDRNEIEQQEMFDFGLKEMSVYEEIARTAKTISIECFKFLVSTLLKQYCYDAEVFEADGQEGNCSRILFGINLPKTETLLLFKEIEPDFFLKLKGREPEDIEKMLSEKGASSCKYVYLMFDKAYLQVIGHNNAEDDPGRGYNLYSVRWFFETYFGTAESDCFVVHANNYIRAVKDALGFIRVKSLTPDSIVSFRLIIESRLIKFDYKSLCRAVANEHNKLFDLEENAYRLLREQFIDQKCYLMLVGNNDFAESFITAEWLRDSLRKAGAIDLTTIALGYFKAIEQLMFELICLHKNEGRMIRSSDSKKRKPIPLDDDNINANIIDTSIGSMAHFHKNNLSMFRDALDRKAKCYIREALFRYADLRNSHLHKENIHDMTRIDEIRMSTIRVMFLLLGAHKLDKKSRAQLGMPDLSIYDDYYRTCEYVNYHSGELYIVESDNGMELWGYSVPDPYSSVVDGRYISYSGFYLKEWTSKSIYRFNENHMPTILWLAKNEVTATQDDQVKMDVRRICKLFEAGKYVGPSLVDEGGLDY